MTKRRITKPIAVLLAVMLVFSALSVLMANAFSDNPYTRKVTITKDVNIAGEFYTPVAGANAEIGDVYNAGAEGFIIDEIYWYNVSGSKRLTSMDKFKSGCNYKLTAILKPDNDASNEYEFDVTSLKKDGACKFYFDYPTVGFKNKQNASVDEYYSSATELRISYTFPVLEVKKVKSFDLYGNVTDKTGQLQEGAKPYDNDIHYSGTTGGYTVKSNKWYDVTGGANTPLDENAVFAADKNYAVEVVLAADINYQFDAGDETSPGSGKYELASDFSPKMTLFYDQYGGGWDDVNEKWIPIVYEVFSVSHYSYASLETYITTTDTQFDTLTIKLVFSSVPAGKTNFSQIGIGNSHLPTVGNKIDYSETDSYGNDVSVNSSKESSIEGRSIELLDKDKKVIADGAICKNESMFIKYFFTVDQAYETNLDTLKAKMNETIDGTVEKIASDDGLEHFSVTFPFTPAKPDNYIYDVNLKGDACVRGGKRSDDFEKHFKATFTTEDTGYTLFDYILTSPEKPDDYYNEYYVSPETELIIRITLKANNKLNWPDEVNFYFTETGEKRGSENPITYQKDRYESSKLHIYIPVKVYREKLGDNVEWTYDEEAGKITLTGTGTVNGFDSYMNTPWYEYKDKIKTVVVGEGITAIGPNTFAALENLSSLTLPSTLVSFGGDVFSGDSSLTAVTIGDKVTNIGINAFKDTGLKSVVIPATVTEIGMNAFNKSVTIIGEKGSAAETYAKENGSEFKEFNIKLGDVNGDGDVDNADAMLLKRYVAGWENITIVEAAADINGDGVIKNDDAMLLKRYVAGWDNEEVTKWFNTNT